MIEDCVTADLLVEMLEGATFANAMRRNGKPGRIRIPDDLDARLKLIGDHLRGAPSTLMFYADGHKPWRERVDAVTLAAFCPGTDGRCRWIGIDLDGADHGERGLVSPVQAVLAIAERADAAGISKGLLVARSRRGQGRHMFMMLAEPVCLSDAVLGVAALATAGLQIATSDSEEHDTLHAFRQVNRSIARPGDSGAVELVPHSSVKPRFGWALALPSAGAFAPHGGGVIMNPFDDRPIRLERVPRCDVAPWSRFIEEARMKLAKRKNAAVRRPKRDSYPCWDQGRTSIDRIDTRTRAFLDGHVPQGTRNASAFAASANLLGCGVEQNEAEHLILNGASACGLPPREALAAFKSAVRAVSRNRGCP